MKMIIQGKRNIYRTLTFAMTFGFPSLSSPIQEPNFFGFIDAMQIEEEKKMIQKTHTHTKFINTMQRKYYNVHPLRKPFPPSRPHYQGYIVKASPDPALEAKDPKSESLGRKPLPSLRILGPGSLRTRKSYRPQLQPRQQLEQLPWKGHGATCESDNPRARASPLYVHQLHRSPHPAPPRRMLPEAERGTTRSGLEADDEPSWGWVGRSEQTYINAILGATQ